MSGALCLGGVMTGYQRERSRINSTSVDLVPSLLIPTLIHAWKTRWIIQSSQIKHRWDILSNYIFAYSYFTPGWFYILPLEMGWHLSLSLGSRARGQHGVGRAVLSSAKNIFGSNTYCPKLSWFLITMLHFRKTTSVGKNLGAWKRRQAA